MEFINSDLAKLVAILVAIVALVYIGMKNKPLDGKGKSIHLWYICGIFTFVMVELITCIVVGNVAAQDIMNYISFASTLSSMILSVLAIFITAASNESLSKVKDVLVDLPKDVQEKINSSLNEMKNTASNVEKLSSGYTESQQQIINKVQSLLEDLDEHLQKGFQDNRQRMDDMGESLKNLSKVESIRTDEEFEPDENFVNRFLINTSYLSLQLVCAFKLYKELQLNQPISLGRLLRCFDQNEADLRMYLYACLVLMKSMGLLNYDQVEKENFDIIQIGELNPIFEKQFTEYFDRTDNSKSTKASLLDYFRTLTQSSADDDQPSA